MTSRLQPPRHHSRDWESLFSHADRIVCYVVCCILIGVVLFECAQQVGH